MAERKRFLLRLDHATYDALERWAGDELRSVNAQIEFALMEALRLEGRQPTRRPRAADADSPEPEPAT
ncbi:MAG: hypothetical protein EXR66_00915 [Dehalococcoidia bacterium]|nr:hypothetical protein [Dehalococcoidia bacterium]